jgi:hypothetical protein
VVASDWPAFDYFYGEREMVLFPAADTADALLTELHAQKVEYVVIAVDEAFEQLGISRRASRVLETSPYLQELIARGSFAQTFSNDYPLQIFYVVP